MREDMDRKMFWRRFHPAAGPESAAEEPRGAVDTRPAQVRLEECDRRLRCVTNSLLGLCHQLYFGEASQNLSRAVLASVVLHLAPCRHLDPRLEELFLRVYYSEGFAQPLQPGSPPVQQGIGQGFALIQERVTSDVEAIRVETAAANPRHGAVERIPAGLSPPQGTYAYGLSPQTRATSGYKMRDPDYKSHALWKSQVQDDVRRRQEPGGPLSPTAKSPQRSAAQLASAKAERLAEVERLAKGEPPPDRFDDREKRERKDKKQKDEKRSAETKDDQRSGDEREKRPTEKKDDQRSGDEREKKEKKERHGDSEKKDKKEKKEKKER